MLFHSPVRKGLLFASPKNNGKWGTLHRLNHASRQCPPFFQQVHGVSSVERRAHYRSLFANQVDYAPPKRPEDNPIVCNQSTHAVRAQAEARKPRGAEAASYSYVLDDAIWPSCAQASQAQTGRAPTRKSWAHVAALTPDRQPRGTGANQPGSTKDKQDRGARPKQRRGAQARHLRGAQDSKAARTQSRQPRGAQDNPIRDSQGSPLPPVQDSPLRDIQDSALRGNQATQSRGGRAYATAVRTWADLFRNTPASGNTDVDALAENP
ncbi:hypothetical protein MTO96_020646 [Rhipicephalus appendiculatus]